mmetsp:Transcript_24615/g.56033  ORF Transcript_24615/g.56033 Transcript_24615/m.56033 type:complete len:86 (+) Transcript_24615:524-781(+)
MEPLIRACEKYEIEVLNILNNQTLGAEGGYALAKALSGSKHLKLTKLKTDRFYEAKETCDAAAAAVGLPITQSAGEKTPGYFRFE